MKQISTIIGVLCGVLMSSTAFTQDAMLLGSKGLSGNEYVEKLSTAILAESNNTTLVSQWNEDLILLRWRSEMTGVNGYFIQHSKDGYNYENVGFIAAIPSGNYFYQVPSYNAGANYYRLVEVKNDNLFAATGAIEIKCGIDGSHKLDIATPVFSTSTKITFQVKQDQDVEMLLLDKFGKIEKSLYKGPMTGHEIIFRELLAEGLSPDVYYILIKGKNFKESKPIVVK